MATIIDIDGKAHRVTVQGLAHIYSGPIGPDHWQGYCPFPKGADKITNWSTGKRAAAAIAELRAKGWQVELRYDAPHGRRYLAVIYPAPQLSEAARSVALASADGISNVRQWAIDSGCDVADLPRCEGIAA